MTMEPSQKISGFFDEYRFLSNFWMVPLSFPIGESQITFPSAEHAYQAAKSENPHEWSYVASLPTAARAKQVGRVIRLRPDWDEIKLNVMQTVLTTKFQNPELRTLLLATGEAQLIEENTWGDTYWGVCKGKGLNHLGKILMIVRSNINI